MMKPWTGHAIGGSGILELALMLVFAREGVLPPQSSLGHLPGRRRLFCGGAAAGRGRMLVKSAASMGGHNVVLSLAVDG